jgi:pSer/pThr/pTyr-binding forkhead associated (FHA) protein
VAPADPEGRAFFEHQQRKRRAAQARLTGRPQPRPPFAASVVSPAGSTMTQPLAVVRVTPQLVVVGGPRAGEAFDLPEGELILGREEGSAIWLRDPMVSHHHALLIRRGNQVAIEDLRSTNGTLVNGTGISSPTSLTPGDVITVGDIQLRLESGPSSAGSGSG